MADEHHAGWIEYRTKVEGRWSTPTKLPFRWDDELHVHTLIVTVSLLADIRGRAPTVNEVLAVLVGNVLDLDFEAVRITDIRAESPWFGDPNRARDLRARSEVLGPTTRDRGACDSE